MKTIDYVSKIQSFLSRRKSIDYAVVFGSVLRRMRLDSDVDILIQGKVNHFQRVKLGLELEKFLHRPVDVVLVDEASCELVLEALKTGRVVVRRNYERLKRDYLKNFYLYDDTTNLRRLREERIRRGFVRG